MAFPIISATDDGKPAPQAPSPRSRGEGRGSGMRGERPYHCAAQSFSRVVDIAAAAEKP